MTTNKIEKLRRQKRCKPIVQMTITGIMLNEFYSISEASRKTGISRTAICNALAKNSGLQMSGGYLWKYC
jgi:hypothetical protein